MFSTNSSYTQLVKHTENIEKIQSKKMKKADISERISAVIAHNHVSINKFAIKLGYKRAQSVYDIVNGKVLPSFDFLYKFTTSEFSEKINIRWLISGEGEMLIDDDSRLEEPVARYSKMNGGFNPEWLKYIESKDQKIIEMAEEIGRLRSKFEGLERDYNIPANENPPFGKGA